MNKLRLVWASLLCLALTIPTTGCDDDEDPLGPGNDSPVVELISPDGGEIIAPSSTFVIEWVTVDDSGIDDVTLTYTADGVTQAVEIATGLAATGTYNWTAPAEALYGVRVQVAATDDKGLVDTDESAGVFAVVVASARGYVTSSTCQDCHAQNYDDVFDSGHPYKLSRVEGAAPTFPFSSVPQPPDGYTWNDITYVIGGYGWKARFMDAEGFIVTTGFNGGTPQYNLERPDLGAPDAQWVGYESTKPTRKAYTCGGCHTTGWQTDAENGGVNQDGLPGIKGTWEEPGITCESCHGPGANHVATKAAAAITLNENAELCGSCHFRDINHRIIASPPFINHHEQYDEMIAGPHTNLGCTACHDPHKGVRYGNAEAGGIRRSCNSCHSDVSTLNHPSGFASAPDCVDCHMGRATKSARAVGEFEGDVRTHIFWINTDPVGREAMFVNEDGQNFAQAFVTLDYACYSCHKDENGLGGNNSTKTLEELSAAAQGMHSNMSSAQLARILSSNDSAMND